jgi:hypothetical protein
MRAQIGEIAEVQIGYQPRGRPEDVLGGNLRVFQMSDLDDDGRLKDVSKLVRVSPDTDSGRYLVHDGNVVFQARGSRSKAFVLQMVPAATLASNHFYIVRMRPNVVLPQFLAWSVNQPSAQVYLTGKAQGTTMMLVPKPAFESLSIDVPPLDVQRMIVELAALRQREHNLVMNLECRRDTLVRALSLRAIARGMK